MLLMLMNYDGPFIVPLGVFAMVLGIVVASQVAEYSKRRLQAEERMAAIAKGIPLPPDPVPDPGAALLNQRNRARGLRTAGIVLVTGSIGAALFAFLLVWITQEHDALVVAACAVVPFFIGIGLLVDYWLQIRDVQQTNELG